MGQAENMCILGLRRVGIDQCANLKEEDSSELMNLAFLGGKIRKKTFGHALFS